MFSSNQYIKKKNIWKVKIKTPETVLFQNNKSVFRKN